MKIRLSYYKWCLVFVGAASLLLVGQKWFHAVNQFKNVNMNSVTYEVPHNPVKHCIAERLPFDIAKLNRMYDGVNTFVMFLGYSQSIDSLTGALLDAHPEVILPQQYDVIGNLKMYQDEKLIAFGKQKYMLFYFIHYLSNFQFIFRNQANKPSQFWAWTSPVDGINYELFPNSWQGRTNDRVKVIGDISSLMTSKKLSKSQSNIDVFEQLQRVIGIPIKFIHIIENPLSAISSQANKKKNQTKLFEALMEVFTLAEANQRMRRLYGNSVLDITINELTGNPRKAFERMCDFLEIFCDEGYFVKVQNALGVFRTRNLHSSQIWTEDQKHLIAAELRKYSFFQPFSSN